MKARFVVLALVLGILLTLSGSGCLRLRRPETVVREPAAPGESTLTYTPPPTPQISLEMVAGLANFKKWITPAVDKITDQVYLARGFALGSSVLVITPDGLVIVDTTESVEAAKKILAEFRKKSDLPIRYLIYTHGHLDHIQGASVFKEPDTQVIATRDWLRFVKQDQETLKPFILRARANQAGRAAPEFDAVKLPIKSPFAGTVAKPELVMPTITFDQEYKFELGGVRFELDHAPGETPDHLIIWMPEQRVLISGDLYYYSFPNLSTPMVEPNRPVQSWAESLERIIALKPAYLVPCHTEALVGETVIRDHLHNYSRAIRFVQDAVIAGINEGKSEEELVRSVALPPELRDLPYLQPLYGRVDWAVRGIYRSYVPWYDGHGSNLDPLPSQTWARELLALAGGADKVLTRAIAAQQNSEHQLAIQLCDLVLQANPQDKVAHLIKASSLDYLAVAARNINTFGFYRSAAALERKAVNSRQ